MKEKYTLQQLKDMKMTDAEKATVWDGVMRRTTDYPEGEYPFEKKPSNWDGILRRKSDFPDETPKESE